MRTLIRFAGLLILFIFFLTCSKNPVSNLNNKNSKAPKLEKRSALIWSDYQYWPTYTLPAPWQGQNAVSDFSFVYNNYNFKFAWTSDGYTITIKCYINYIEKNSLTYSKDCNGFRLEKTSSEFYQDTRKVQFKVTDSNGSATISYPYQYQCIDYPYCVRVGMENFIAPDVPTGFNLTPESHPDEAANPVLTWNQTTDNDVTHVEIWRQQVDPLLSYSLIATISKSNTSYTDYTCDWNLPTGRRYRYKIRFKDATHNLFSNYTNEKISSSL